MVIVISINIIITPLIVSTLVVTWNEDSCWGAVRNLRYSHLSSLSHALCISSETDYEAVSKFMQVQKPIYVCWKIYTASSASMSVHFILIIFLRKWNSVIFGSKTDEREFFKRNFLLHFQHFHWNILQQNFDFCCFNFCRVSKFSISLFWCKKQLKSHAYWWYGGW